MLGRWPVDTHERVGQSLVRKGPKWVGRGAGPPRQIVMASSPAIEAELSQGHANGLQAASPGATPRTREHT